MVCDLSKSIEPFKYGEQLTLIRPDTPTNTSGHMRLNLTPNLF